MKKSVKKLLILSLVPFIASCTSTNTSSSSGTSTSEPARELLGIEFAEDITFPSGIKVFEKLYTNLNFIYSDGTEKVTYNSFKDDNVDISFKLFKEGSSVDVINEELEEDTKYILEATYGNFVATKEFVPNDKVTLLKKEDLSITYQDLDSDVSPAIGDVKMLVIPIDLPGDWTDTIKSEDLSLMDDLYFGDDPLSLTSYYKDASNGQMNISGMISEVYHAPSKYTTNALQDEESGMSLLQTLLKDALTYVENLYPTVDWSTYDLNGNYAIDNIHLVTNFNPDTYQSETGKQVWSTPLWPHKSTLNNHDGTKSRPTIRTYSCGVLSHLLSEGGSAITPIHEQGHIFGLPDYYDYGFQVDYLGSYDMQSNNVFDWNSYSKLSVGWTDAYVVKDECTITIDTASLGGIPLIIPADYDSFNGSAFDEYFLIELFSNYGNNAKFPDVYNYVFDGNQNGYGVRMYHVDNRLVTNTGKTTDNPNSGFEFINNSCYAYNEYYYGGYSQFKKFLDYKQLALIQKGGEDTFGDTTEYSRKTLAEEDLFKAGDTFTFEDYGHFLSKQQKTKYFMDDGEEFPYSIKFVRMDSKTATIRISKIVTE